MTEVLHVLLVEDSFTDAKLVIHALAKLGRPVEVERVETPEAMSAMLDSRPWDLVLSDWAMPRFSALAALAVLKERHLDIPFIIVSGTIGEETAVEAMRAGAQDFVLKDKLVRLAPAIERVLREAGARAARREAEAGRLRAENALHLSQEQLRQAQKMEAIGRLAGGVAHDFNNALSVILSYVELAMPTLPAGESLREDLGEVHKAAERAAELTRQLLLFSRQSIAEPKVIDLDELLQNLRKMLGRILGEDIDLVLVLPEGVGRIRVHPSHIEQVIMNLVVNARDAMPTGGKLTIEAGNVFVDSAYAASHLPLLPGHYVMLAVTDTGVGMSPAVQERIFEPFFTTKETGKGTGLGLSTVFGIVQQSGGTVWVYSEPGKGTTFKIYLPRVDAEVYAPIAPFDPDTLRGAEDTLRGVETILLVEDDEQVRRLAASVLRDQGYEVITAQHPDEALLLCASHPDDIDLLVTDVVMPRMSGPDLARRLTKERPLMKVLCMSGYTDDSIVRHGILDGSIPFVQKPITPALLTRKVRAVLDGAVSNRIAVSPLS